MIRKRPYDCRKGGEGSGGKEVAEKGLVDLGRCFGTREVWESWQRPACGKPFGCTD